MALENPIHSFVDFENRLSNVVLPAYMAQLAFQVKFSSDMNVPRTGSIRVYAGNAARNAKLFGLSRMERSSLTVSLPESERFGWNARNDESGFSLSS